MIAIHQKYGYQLGEQAQDIVYNVYKYFLKDDLKCYWNTMPYYSIVELVAMATGVSPATVRWIIDVKEPPVPGQARIRRKRLYPYKNQNKFTDRGQSLSNDFDQQNKMFQSEVARITCEIENDVKPKIEKQESANQSSRIDLNMNSFKRETIRIKGEIEDNKNDVKEYIQRIKKIKTETVN